MNQVKIDQRDERGKVKRKNFNNNKRSFCWIKWIFFRDVSKHFFYCYWWETDIKESLCGALFFLKWLYKNKILFLGGKKGYRSIPKTIQGALPWKKMEIKSPSILKSESQIHTYPHPSPQKFEEKKKIQKL